MTDEQEDQKSKLGKIEVGIGDSREALTRTEMPLRMLVLGDFAPGASDVENWEGASRLINVTPRDFESVMQQLEPRLTIDVPNCLSDSPKELTIELTFTDMKAFHPEGIAHQVKVLSSILELRKLVGQLRERKLTIEEFDEQFRQTGMDQS